MVSNSVLGLAVFILFIHAIFQQSILYDLRSQLTTLTLNKNVSPDEILKEPIKDLYAPNYYMKTKSPPNLPSVRLSESEERIAAQKRTIYGGKGDALHLGGFTQRDDMGISNNLWNFMLGPLAIKSVVDVGCGKGVSTRYFFDHGAKVLCVEGSHDAVTQSLLPAKNVVEHDFSRGPWWPDETFDAVWSVEFLEV